MRSFDHLHRRRSRRGVAIGGVILLTAFGDPALAGADVPSGLPASASPPDSLSILPVHLDLDIAVDYASGSIEGQATWRLRNVGAASIRTIPLQLGRLMRVDGVKRTASAAPLDYQQDVVTYDDWPQMQVNQLHVRLATPLDPGDEVSLSIRYGGTLVPYTETGMRYVRDHVNREFTILRAESFAFPQVRVPSFATWRDMPRGPFAYRLRVTVPEDQRVATGTAEISRTRVDREPATGGRSAEGLIAWTFESEEPVPFLLVAIAPYETLERAGLRVYHFPEDAAGARSLMGAMLDALDRYEEWFGPVGSELRLHVIEIPEGWGSQADLNAGIIQTADAFRSASELPQLYHELAHLWHPADSDAAPPRWNEGLATFLQHRMAHARGEIGSLAQTFAALATRQVERFEGSGMAKDVAMLDYGNRGATGLSYGTGALMFYALYRVLGEAEFDRTLGNWFRTYRATGSTSGEFMAAMQTSTDVDLGPLFEDWLETAHWYERLRAGESLEAMVATYR